MKNFDSLLNDVTITKILNYFGYRLSFTSPKYNAYTKESIKFPYYVFNDIDTDSLQIFSPIRYKKLSKTELLFTLCQADSIEKATTVIPEISAFTVLDNNVNLSTSISISSLTNILAELIEPDYQILPITRTVQFKRRVFLTPDGYYKTPLFYHHLEQSISNRIVNFVKWNETEIHYLNNNAYCLNASFFSEENKYLFVTSSPGTWITFPTLKNSPDYFQLLCHPDAPITMHHLLYNIFRKYKFAKCFFHINDNYLSNSFTTKCFTFFLNQLSNKFVFDINYSSDRYYIQITYFNNRDLNIEIAKLFSSITNDLHEHFYSVYQNEYDLPEDVENMVSLNSEKIEVGEKITTIESISGQQNIAKVFFNSFIKNLKLDNQLEVIGL